jgi:hypothetical protein
MADVAVAMDAGEHFTACLRWDHFVDEVLMAMQACALGHSTIPRLDLNWLVKVFECECQRMKEAVVGLGDPLTNWMVWEVAIIAHRDMLMARILPGVVMALHDVTVDARRGVITEVTCALTVAKGEGADAAKDAQ